HLQDAANSNRVIRYAREKGITPSDIALYSAQVEDKLKNSNIRIRQTPKYEERYQIDEIGLEKVLSDGLGQVTRNAVLHDINSIRSVYVLRGGTTPLRLEDSKAVLVTNNSRLAEVADEFAKKNEFSRAVSPLITDSSLANICWLKRPAASEELANMELLATSVAALRPTDGEWQACLNEVEKLRAKGAITDDQEILVRESLSAPEDLITLTKGVGESFGPQVALELVRRAELRIAAPLEDEIHARDARLTELRKELEAQQKEASRRRLARDAKARKVADIFARLIGAVIVLILLLA